MNNNRLFEQLCFPPSNLYFEIDKAALVILIIGALFSGIVRAAHPLITEDTGTQGSGKFQLELNAAGGYKDNNVTLRNARNFSAALSYGVRDNIDLIVSGAHTRVIELTGDGRVTHDGTSDSGLDLKWRFLEKPNLSFALKPGVTLPTGDETKGLGSGKSRYSLMFVATMDPSPWSFNLHFGFTRNHNVADEREAIWHASFGGYRTLDSKKMKLVFDTGADTNPDKSSHTPPAFLILGFIYSPNEDFDLDLGVKRGLTRPETDYTLLGGITFRF